MVGTGGEGCDPTTGSWENCGWVEKYRQSPFEMVGNNPLDMCAGTKFFMEKTSSVFSIE